MALPPTMLSDLLYLATSDQVFNKLKEAGFLNETGLADSDGILHMSEQAVSEAAAVDMPGPNHADILADALHQAGVLNEAGMKAYYLDLRGI